MRRLAKSILSLGVSLALVLLPGSAALPSRGDAEKVTIVWDTWGVPHIDASSDASMMYAFGWAQLRNNPRLLLRLYGEARGKAAEYWGSTYRKADQIAIVMGFERNAERTYARQPQDIRREVDAFAAGINAYAAANPAQIPADVRVVLPVRAIDVFARLQKIYLEFSLNGTNCNFGGDHPLGSNAWAIGARGSATGHAMLLADPHLGWEGSDRLTEVQLRSPDVDAYGVTLLGLPFLVIGFNRQLAWTITTNVVNTCDIYQLTTDADGYVLDGKHERFEETTESLRVKGSDGVIRVEPFHVRRSRQGPVIKLLDTYWAIRAVGFDLFPDTGSLREFRQLSTARSVGQFSDALSALQIPYWNFLAVDSRGSAMYVFNGKIPVKPVKDWNYWVAGAIAGDTSRTIWTSLYGYESLPKVVDPPAGWLQSSNGPPWTVSLPPPLEEANFSPDLTSRWAPNLREERSLQMLGRDTPMTLEKLVDDSYSTYSHLTDLVLDDLVDHAAAQPDPLLREASVVLAHWDRQFEPGSRGAVLFSEWCDRAILKYPYASSDFREPWSISDPTGTPRGLADVPRALAALRDAAAAVQSQYGSLDVPYGTVNRIRYGRYDLPGFGSVGDRLGTFEVVTYRKAADGKNEAIGGETFRLAIEYSQPLRALGLLTYGNSSDPASPHYGDQLPLFARHELRPIWFTRDDVDQHAELTETLKP
jgi:acyl-homoserine-lactone acylase